VENQTIGTETLQSYGDLWRICKAEEGGIRHPRNRKSKGIAVDVPVAATVAIGIYSPVRG